MAIRLPSKTQVKSECDTVLNNCVSLGYNEFNRLKSLASPVERRTTSPKCMIATETAGGRTSLQAVAIAAVDFNTADDQVTNGGIAYDAVRGIS